MKFERYLNIKNTKLAWLGNISSEWKMQRLKDIINYIDQGWSPNAENRIVTNEEWGVLKLSAINNGNYIEHEHKALSEITKPKVIYKVKQGHTLMTRSNTPSLVGDVCYVKNTRYNMMYSDLIYRLSVIPRKVNSQYLTYILTSANYRTQIIISAKGLNNSMVKISQQSINNWYLPLPVLETQVQIVGYLDKSTNKLDNEISLLKQKIQKYKELKQNIVNEAVLRGITKNVELKDTNITWIGKIPKHWSIQRLKDIDIKISSGIENFEDEKNYLSTKSISENKIQKIEGAITFNNRPSRANMQPTENSVWFAKMRFTKKYFLFNNQESASKYILSTGFYGLHVKHFYPNFIKYYVMADYFLYEKNKYSYGTTQESITDTYIGQLSFIQPPYEEQVEVASYLDEKTTKIDEIVKTLGTKVETLKEFRKTLINDVVTGKVKVA